MCPIDIGAILGFIPALGRLDCARLIAARMGHLRRKVIQSQVACLGFLAATATRREPPVLIIVVDEGLKYNDNHDENGRFSSGGGGGKETQTSDLGLNHLPPEMSHPGGDKPGTIKPTQGWNEAQDRTDIYGTHSVPEASKPDVQTSDWGLKRLPPETKTKENPKNT